MFMKKLEHKLMPVVEIAKVKLEGGNGDCLVYLCSNARFQSKREHRFDFIVAQTITND